MPQKGFTNPSPQQQERYIHRTIGELLEQPNEEAIFRLLDSGDLDMKDVLETAEKPEFSFEIDQETTEPPEIDSFTYAGGILQNMEHSNFRSLQYSEDLGIMKIGTVSGHNFMAWTPWLEESRTGSLVGQLYSPWTEETQAFKYGFHDENTENFDDRLLNMIYSTSRETIPRVPCRMPNWNPVEFKKAFSKVAKGKKRGEEYNFIEELESNGNVGIGNNNYIGKKQGRDALEAVQGFINRARDARIVDYFVEIDYSNSELNVINGGYKFLTQNYPSDEKRGFKTNIDERIADSWT